MNNEVHNVNIMLSLLKKSGEIFLFKRFPKYDPKNSTGENNSVRSNIFRLKSPIVPRLDRAMIAVTISNHEKISLNCCLPTFTERKKIASGGPLMEMLPVKKPVKAPAKRNESLVAFIEIFNPREIENDNAMKKIHMLVISICSGRKFSVITPTTVKSAAKKIKGLNEWLSFFCSFFCKTMIPEENKLHNNKTGIISLGEYQSISKGNETRLNPKPVIPLSKLAKAIMRIIYKVSIVKSFSM